MEIDSFCGCFKDTIILLKRTVYFIMHA